MAFNLADYFIRGYEEGGQRRRQRDLEARMMRQQEAEEGRYRGRQTRSDFETFGAPFEEVEAGYGVEMGTTQPLGTGPGPSEPGPRDLSPLQERQRGLYKSFAERQARRGMPRPLTPRTARNVEDMTNSDISNAIADLEAMPERDEEQEGVLESLYAARKARAQRAGGAPRKSGTKVVTPERSWFAPALEFIERGLGAAVGLGQRMGRRLSQPSQPSGEETAVFVNPNTGRRFPIPRSKWAEAERGGLQRSK